MNFISEAVFDITPNFAAYFVFAAASVWHDSEPALIASMLLQAGGRVGAGEGSLARQARGDRRAVGRRQGGAVRALLRIVLRPAAAAAARAAPPAPRRRAAHAVQPAGGAAARRARVPHGAAGVPRAREGGAAQRRQEAQDGAALRRGRLLALRTISERRHAA